MHDLCSFEPEIIAPKRRMYSEEAWRRYLEYQKSPTSFQPLESSSNMHVDRRRTSAAGHEEEHPEHSSDTFEPSEHSVSNTRQNKL
ncbi:unnamed protein product [Enterobius vermicularis]|uniref:Ovule protein n=1 Tax=Enterobius vermicularis TaxID=51028 RepID=A0A0N4V3X0_ENTVE|nr:unnamed protein product [Enterobius vermicularis]